MLLSLAIWVPILAGLLVLAVGTDAGDDRKARAAAHDRARGRAVRASS